MDLHKKQAYRVCVFCKTEIPNDSNSKYCTSKCRQKKYTSKPETINKRHIAYKNIIRKKWQVDDLEGELWKTITGCEKYLVSNLGRVKHLMCGEKLVPIYILKKYKVIKIIKDTKQKTIKVHELVAYHFVDNPRKLKHISHIDSNILNNNANNLQWYVPLPEREKVKITMRKKIQNGVEQETHTVKYTNSKDVVCIKQFINKEDAQAYALTCKARLIKDKTKNIKN